MHGAAVVIDVPTGQVRALVSYPTFDANKFADLYPLLKDDQLNKPFLNRATQLPVEPGSAIKPVVGIGAISQGLIRTDQGIECTGYLIINGKRQSVGRCWTASKFATLYPDKVAHHQIPTQDPHHDGHLIFSDALQRSCNVYFETLGDRLKAQGLSYWFHQFGLGRKTGIGIPEWPGYVPDDYTGDAVFPSMQWFAAIGQGQIAATPLQMANVAATIARDGIWVRPRLLTNDADAPPPRNARHEEIIPDRRDLKASPAAIAAAKQGMIRVVNSRAGTGLALRDPQILIAGKTGTAQVPPLRRKRIDQNGQVVREEYPVSTREKRIPETLWYRGTGHKNAELSHAWFIGFAPANAPKIAFAVLLEYGGSGGADAAVVAKGVLEACKEHGYLAVQN
ncbi:MAG: penicillin-binding transpeptidase domain-containing protein [Planctomycetota bacterium]|nr:penicillin-binding transpeptidase domain-containing protein [Planctomycetota bacterium]